MWKAGLAGMGAWIGQLGFADDAFIRLSDISLVMFYFVLYAVGGWALEHGYHRVKQGRFAEAGFLAGPYKPMYGFAPVILLCWIGPYTPWWWTVVLLAVVPTLVEGISGILLKYGCRRQWWDYSGCRYQLGGIICLRFSFYWMVLCFAVVYGIHPLLAALVQQAGAAGEWYGQAIAAVMTADLAATAAGYAKRSAAAK